MQQTYSKHHKEWKNKNAVGQHQLIANEHSLYLSFHQVSINNKRTTNKKDRYQITKHLLKCNVSNY